jgi:FMN phosphatase YigB (HAD superfamily)
MIKNILFDLDGTLLPMDIKKFIYIYTKGLSNKMNKLDSDLVMKVLFKGIENMYANDGSKTNEKVFIETFESMLNISFDKCEKSFEEYYHEDFELCKTACMVNDKARKLIDYLKSKGIRIVIATNPFFPQIATYTRLRWLGLEPYEFELVTTYENSHFCKPNPKYFEELFNKLNMKPEESLMVGNDVEEDGCIKALGVKLFLIKDCLINNKNLEINADFIGSFEEVVKEIEYVVNEK